MVQYINVNLSETRPSAAPLHLLKPINMGGIDYIGVLLFVNQTVGRKFSKSLSLEFQGCMQIKIFCLACHCKIAFEIKPVKAFQICIFFVGRKNASSLRSLSGILDL
jgi:hypothetical protein